LKALLKELEKAKKEKKEAEKILNETK